MYCDRQGSRQGYQGGGSYFPNPITNFPPVNGFNGACPELGEGLTAGFVGIWRSKPRREPCPEPCRMIAALLRQGALCPSFVISAVRFGCGRRLS